MGSHQFFIQAQVKSPVWVMRTLSGRLGAMTGPLLTGKILALGLGTTGILVASFPAVVHMAVAVTALSRYKAAD